MGKNQQKNTFNDASGLLNSTEGPNAALSSAAESAATKSGAAASGAYSSLLPSGGYDPTQLAGAQAGNANLTASGGYSAPQLNTLEGAETANLGGLDPNSLGELTGGYQNLISSGGISDATQAAMQRQATSGVKSIYGTLANNLNRSRSATGGEGGAGETAAMARQLGQSEADAVTGVNSQVGQLRQAGTEAGLSGGSNLAAAQAAAQNQAANAFSGTQSGVAGGVQYGTSLADQTAANVASGRLSSAGGLTNIYDIDQNTSLGQQGLGLKSNLGYLGAMTGIANNQPPWYQSLAGATKAIGGVAGGISGLATGGG